LLAYRRGSGVRCLAEERKTQSGDARRTPQMPSFDADQRRLRLVEQISFKTDRVNLHDDFDSVWPLECGEHRRFSIFL
jgi:hypothetical protein